MKITPKNQQTRKFQVGGAMPAGAPTTESTVEPTVNEEAPVQEQAPVQGEEQDPIMMLAQMSAQAIQSQDCQMAMQVCQAFLEIVQQMQGGAPEEPQGEPVFRRGGTLVRRIKK